jgi:hypothetical protein
MSARGTATFVAAWGLGLLVLAATGPLLGERDRVALAELPAAAAGALLLAAGVVWLGRRRPVAGRDAPPASAGAALLGLGLTLVGAGAAVGLWLVYLAAPVVVLGLYALVMEARR